MVQVVGIPRPADGWIDLRSDAVTRPSSAMWRAMQSDPLEWGRAGDRTVAELERRVASMAGLPSGLFVPTGTMANTLALMGAAQRGDSFAVDQAAHVVRAEGDAYSQIAGLAAITMHGPRGHPTIQQLADCLSDEVRPTLLWLENTHTFAGGTISPLEQNQALIALAKNADMTVHLDGARLWNAAVAAGCALEVLVAGADTVTLNLDKGLGCPGGAILCGSEGKIAAARRTLPALGGLLAQPGLLAACGLVALADFVPTLERDHVLAKMLATGLRNRGVEVDDPDTNIVIAHVTEAVPTIAALRHEGILAFARDARSIRFVLHREVSVPDVERVTESAFALESA